METFDLNLFVPQGVQWKLEGVAISGGVPVGSAQPRTSLTDGGGFWTCSMTGIWLRTADQLRAALAFEGRMDRGATPLLVPYRDIHLGPTVNDKLVRSGSVTAFGAALRATEIKVKATVGVVLVGGETFSIAHATKGKRLYRVVEVVSTSGMRQTVKIRPPLREAVAANVAVDFSTPSCVMRLANAGDFFDAIDRSRFSYLNPTFVEAIDAA